MDNKANKMLIDATHPEETRVVVLRNGRVEEFDFESAARKPLRGNIYLAKVTRVEPSLQAAFIEYGGNRHGFLAFSEIHPDYYQIPMADRQALIAEEAEAEAEADAEADARAEARLARQAQSQGSAADGSGHEAGGDGEPGHGHAIAEARHGDDVRRHEAEPHGHDSNHTHAAAHGNEGREQSGDGDDEHQSHVEEVANDAAIEPPEVIAGGEMDIGSGEDAEDMPVRPRRRMRSYKIQEVIKRRQVILVQVVKEERGNKGAALTTYLSLAGRYTVLMPNTGRGGGISRKITSAQDRKRLKAIAHELEVPDGMGLIIRTAGAARTKPEVKRDYEYLIRLWESVRDLTLQSVAPSLVYEEGNLIKRSIRDLYTKEIDEIVVAGSDAYREAADFMRMLMPSHVRNVTHHHENDQLFQRYPIERQLNAMFSPHVTLRSGGYLVINQTEALVAIDVNSGKSTREFSIEETALATNLEAADEVARQLKLRDLAGLVVIDFIDMEEKRNNRSVERRMKDALRFDRARIQVGRISHFGLMEMSRQRLRTGVLEGSTTKCPHCEGTGTIRSTESVALAVLRGLDEHLSRDGRHSVVTLTSPQVALFLLNNKRSFITEMESRFGVSIAVEASERMHGAAFEIERSAAPLQPIRRQDNKPVVNMEWGFEGEEHTPNEHTAGTETDHIEEVDHDEDRHEARSDDDERGEPRGESEGDRQGRGKRRRRRGRGRDREAGPNDNRQSGDQHEANGSAHDDDGAGHVTFVGEDETAESRPRRDDRDRQGGRDQRHGRGRDDNGRHRNDNRGGRDNGAAPVAVDRPPVRAAEFDDADRENHAQHDDNDAAGTPERDQQSQGEHGRGEQGRDDDGRGRRRRRGRRGGKGGRDRAAPGQGEHANHEAGTDAPASQWADEAGDDDGHPAHAPAVSNPGNFGHQAAIRPGASAALFAAEAAGAPPAAFAPPVAQHAAIAETRSYGQASVPSEPAAPSRYQPWRARKPGAAAPAAQADPFAQPATDAKGDANGHGADPFARPQTTASRAAPAHAAETSHPPSSHPAHEAPAPMVVPPASVTAPAAPPANTKKGWWTRRFS